MKQMTPAAVERAMKLQDVMLRAMAKRITWYQAAEILGLSGRQMLRWQTRFKHEGYEGLFDRRRGTPSPKRVPLETVETVLRLYQEQYFDFNVRHFHEKLGSEHGIKLSYTWVKAALQGAGLVKARKQRGKQRKRRPRRPLPGMLLHIDGSQHRWFCDDRWYDLLVIMDDATSEVYYAQLVEEESTATVMAGLRTVIEEQGVFCALYSDRASHFFLTPKAGEPVDHHRLPMHDPPLSVMFFKHCRSQSSAIDMTWLTVIHNVRRYCVFQSSPRSVAGEVNLDVAEFVLRILHLTHLGNEIVVSVVSPAIISVAALEDY